MSVLAEVVAANRAGERRGIPSYCTAHPETLSAIFARYQVDTAPILIEATCNQVNQFGGYTGMTPAAFRRFVEKLARDAGVDPQRLILGGDHLGPNPWKNEPADTALAKARDLVAAYVAAGFTKIHLDASMACGGEAPPTEAAIAERAADLCAVAEANAITPLSYVIGTEVPIPGGETEVLDALDATRPEAVRRTWDLHRQAFNDRGLAAALDRVVGIVVQPGVDFGNAQVFPFSPSKAAPLAAAVTNLPGAAFEAHSTDYQTETALAGLVSAHFPILKVGPELTFAFRQAVMALENIEQAMSPSVPSRLAETIIEEMEEHPRDWRGYVAAGPRERDMMIYGLSDRVRYYWPRPAIQQALARLRSNLDALRPEPGIVAQFTGGLVLADEHGASPFDRVVRSAVGEVVTKYRNATAC